MNAVPAQSLPARTHLRKIAAVFALLLGSHLSFAQAGGKGTIQGTVTDPSGAIVRDADVTATLVDTQETVSQKTTSAGFYALASLKPGVYTVTVKAPGFESYVQQNVTLDALQVFGLNAALTIGATNDTVTISAAPPPLDTTNATLGTTMENETYEALPLNMGGGPRDPTAFVYLTPGVSSSSGYGSFNGGQGFHNEVYLEGLAITNAAAAGGGNTASVNRGASVDAIDQFQVQTAGTSAAYQGQGLENYTLKSGTNQFHGRAFEYFRNTVLDTWGFFSKAKINPATGAPSKPVERQNEFGGTFGGPILHDKLFFFASYDGQRFLNGVNPSYVNVPTVAERNGDFSAFTQAIYDPLTTVCNAAGSSCTRTQFPGNIIPASRFSPQSLYYQKFIPLPTNGSLTSNYLGGFNTGFNYSKYSIKADYDTSRKNRITFLFLKGGRDANPACCDGSGLPPPFTATVGNFQYNSTGILEDTYTITDRWINQFKYGVARSGSYSTNPGEDDPSYAATAAGITNLPPGQASLAAPRIGFGGNFAVASLGGTSNSNNQANSEYGTTYVLFDTMQYVRGRHSMSWGGQYQWLNDNNTTLTTGTYLNLNYASSETAYFTKTGTGAAAMTTSTPDTTTGSSYASYLLGAVDNAGLSDTRPAITTGARFYTFSPFFQDDIKATQRLTLNVGLRWDLYSPFREVENRLSFLDITRINPITGTPGALSFAGNGVAGCNCSSPVTPWYKNFGPHLGFAYSATPKTVLRGAFNISYVHAGGVGGRNGARNGTGQLGFTGGGSYASVHTYDPAFYLNSTNSAIPSYSLPPVIDPSYGTGYTTTPGYTGTPQGMTYADPYLSRRAPYYEDFNFGVQQEIFKQTVLSVNYAGSNGRFLGTSEGRGIYSNQLDPRYYFLGSLLGVPANAANIAKVQALLPSYKLPFPNFSPTASIGQSLRPFPQYNGISDVYGDIGMSSYNSLQLTLSQRPRSGLSYTFNYTYSKLFDNTDTGRSSYNNSQDRSLGLTDRPENISAYFVYAEPFGKGSHFYDKLIRSFEISSIFTYTSGTPLNITGTGCVTSFAGTCEPYLNPAFSGPVRINGSWGHGVTSANTSIPFIDANAFIASKLIPTYTFGNAPRTYAYGLRGPGGYNDDMSLRRSFGIYEKLRLNMQIDAFNVTNHTRFANPNVSLGSENYATSFPFAALNTGSFGTISGTSGSSRDLQIVARFDF